MFKKIILAAVLAATASFAQVNFGAHLGLGLSTLWGDEVYSEDFGSGFSFQLGGAAKITLPALPITLAPEILVDMRNASQDYNGHEFAISEWAIDIPVLVRISAMPILFIEAGPQLSINASTSSDEILNVSIEDVWDFNAVEFNVVVGAGTTAVPFVDIDFRVVVGLTNWISESKIIKGEDAPELSNLQFLLGATYWF